MKNTIDINFKYKKESLPFKKGSKVVYSPRIPVLIKDPNSGKLTSFTNEFIIDTGASISIINVKYKSFLESIEKFDELKVRYGAGKQKWLPVYKLIFLIKGTEIDVTVAYDKDLPFLLLGHYGFFENLSYQLFDSSLKKSRLVKY